MKVRGRRRCTGCGNSWSYFETGSATCPDCGSLRSVGVDDGRSLHTDSPVSLDLSAARSKIDERPIQAVAGTAATTAREYLLDRGFVRGGELLALDDTVLAAAELRHVAGRLERALVVEEPEERHLVDLLAGAEAGARPVDVPPPLRDARGLAAVDAVSAYRRDLSAWIDERADPDSDGGESVVVKRLLTRLRDHEKRISALEGDVPATDADAIVAAARGIGNYLREGDEDALASASERLDDLE